MLTGGLNNVLASETPTLHIHAKCAGDLRNNGRVPSLWSGVEGQVDHLWHPGAGQHQVGRLVVVVVGARPARV
jgi:hypothetical protein